MLVLYNSVTSVCSVKVRLGLAEIGLDYESRVLNLQQGEQFDSGYLKLNPSAVVPTLIDDGLILVESSLILEYLDRTYNNSLLMPLQRAESAAARLWLLRCLALHAAINTMTFSTVMRKRMLAKKSIEEIEVSIALMPDAMAQRKRSDLVRNGLNSHYVLHALNHLSGVLSELESVLSSSPWISGSEFGIADIAIVPYIDRLERLGFEGLWTNSAPSVAKWLVAMQSRSSYQAELIDKITTDAAVQMQLEGADNWDEIKTIWNTIDR